jgi:N-acetylglutamate synthase-like GNAT family acetyltransferase
LHYHEKAQQVFYVLSGTATFEVNGKFQTVLANESIHINTKLLHRISNHHNEDLQFVLISQPKAQGDRIDIIDYSEEFKEPIKILNYEWLEKYFKIEPGDIVSLSNPKQEIIDKGGLIFYARWKNEIVGTASLLRETDEVFELAKMAVNEKAQGHYIGNALMERCLQVAKIKGVKKIILYSNTILGAACTQAYKISKIRNIPDIDINCVSYVSIDFNKESLTDKLNEAGYDPLLKTFFIWEGVSMYLTKEAVDETLSFVSQNKGKNSSIFFDYMLGSVLDGSCKYEEAIAIRMTGSFNANGEETYTFYIPDNTIHSFLKERGFNLIEEHNGESLKQKYFKSNQNRKVHRLFGYVHAEIIDHNIKT